MPDDVKGENFRETQGVLCACFITFPHDILMFSLHTAFGVQKYFRDLCLERLDNVSKNIKIKHMIVSVNVPACDIAITTWRVHNAELIIGSLRQLHSKSVMKLLSQKSLNRSTGLFVPLFGSNFALLKRACCKTALQIEGRSSMSQFYFLKRE